MLSKPIFKHDSLGEVSVPKILSRLWQTVEEFHKEMHEGYCWIVYEGRKCVAYHYRQQFFLTHRFIHGRYMTECVTQVQPIVMPDTAPEGDNTEEHF